MTALCRYDDPMTNAELTARSLAHVWNPCTQMQDHEWLPLIPVRRAEGVWLEDFEGKRYLDAVSSWWTNIFGHRHPHIVQALRNQLDELDHVLLAGFTHEPAVALAEKLCALTGLNRVFYSDNGSSAVEVALKMSFHYWRNRGEPRRTRFVALSNGYHGETLGALAVGDTGLYRDLYKPLLMQPLIVPSPDCYERAPGASWEDHSRQMFVHMEATLERHAGEVCAVIVEPLVQCAGGMRMYHPIYLKLLRAACDRYGVHLIADEIATGFGRTGRMFACEWAGIKADLMCLSKGLTGGTLPLSATLATEDIYQAFYAEHAAGKAFLHSHSYTGNALACRAALATLELFEQSNALATNKVLETQMWAYTGDLRSHPHVAEVRQQGMILAIEMARNIRSREPYPAVERRGLRAYQHALSRGVLLRPLGNVLYFMPPYVITPREIELLCKVALESVHEATR
jgi:adenosylmethionine---8-amino-7-oxononanoate aminotransferase